MSLAALKAMTARLELALWKLRHKRMLKAFLNYPKAFLKYTKPERRQFRSMQARMAQQAKTR